MNITPFSVLFLGALTLLVVMPLFYFYNAKALFFANNLCKCLVVLKIICNFAFVKFKQTIV